MLTVASVTVPSAGSYWLSYTGDMGNGGTTNDNIVCDLDGPGSTVIDFEGVSVPPGATDVLAMQGLDTVTAVSGGTFTVKCSDSKSAGLVAFDGDPELVALRVSSASGDVTTNGANAAPAKTGTTGQH